MSFILTKSEQLQLLKYCIHNIFNYYINQPNQYLLPLNCVAIHLKRGIFNSIKDIFNRLMKCIETVEANKNSILNV